MVPWEVVYRRGTNLFFLLILLDISHEMLNIAFVTLEFLVKFWIYIIDWTEYKEDPLTTPKFCQAPAFVNLVVCIKPSIIMIGAITSL